MALFGEKALTLQSLWQCQNRTLTKNTMESAITLSPTQLFVKRTVDIIASFMVLAVLWPVLLLVALFVKCEDGGPMFFSQVRLGKGGKPFFIYKFRTMVVGAEQDDAPQLCQNDDNRLTRVGKRLRQLHLDELPQFWNVLKGDMSLVGYRPERKFFIEQIMKNNPDYAKLYAMRPGIFSYAAIYNGYTDTMEKMLKRLDMDLDYMHSFSIATDIQIIFKTIIAILTGKKI